MRIAISVCAGAVCGALGACEAFCFYEDDHGKIVRSFRIDAGRSGTEAAVALLEQYGIDALVCGALSGEERLIGAAAGLMIFPGYQGAPDEAALQFLSGAIAFDPNNTCNACGHGHSCSMDCASCPAHRAP